MFKDLATLRKHSHNIKLLYVEDDIEIQQDTLEMLKNFFSIVHTANNGEEGLEVYKKESIDLIITDLSMPIVNGFELIEEIRKSNNQIPIVVCSASDESQHFIKSISLGINGYILKPIVLDSFIATIKYVTEAINLKKTLDYQNLLMKQYMEVTDKSSIVSKTDSDGVITYVNEAFCQFTGFSKEELIGQTHHILSHFQTDHSFYENMWKLIKNDKKIFQDTIKNVKKSGEIYHSKTTILPLLDTTGEITEFIAIHTDVTPMMKPSQQLHDFLHSSLYPTVVMLEIEGFSHLQSFFGNQASEKIEEAFVNSFANRLNMLIEDARIYAIGGGKIVLAGDNVTVKVLHEKLKSFQHEVYKSTIEIEDIEYDPAVIISVASGECAFEDALAGLEFLEKNASHFINAQGFSEQVKVKAKENLDMLECVKSALDNNRVISYFQPIIDNATQEIVKYESLVRVVDAQGNILTPWQFLEVAKQGKFYTQITDRVIKHSFEVLAKTSKEISINLSIQDIERENTKNTIYETLEKYKESANRVVFELLEDENVSEFELVKEFIVKVKSYGVQIAIDDFGAGYSNYERLMQYQPDILKIDGSLIKNIHKDDYIHSVVESIVNFAKQNNMKTIAEFVEDVEVYNCIKELGIEYSQGYYFAKPDIQEKVLA